MGEVQYILSTLYNYLTHALRAARPRSTPDGSPSPCTGRGSSPGPPPPEEGCLPGPREGDPGRGQGPAARG